MSKDRIVIFILALILIAVGVFWLTAIYQRCTGLHQKPRPAVQGPRIHIVTAVKETVKQAEELPYVEPYQVIMFWGLVGLEIGCAVFFILSGVFLIGRFELALWVVRAALVMDIVFKIGVVSYFHWVAQPLAHLTKRGNIVIKYYTPQSDVWSEASGYLTALRAFQPNGWAFLGIYVCVLFSIVFCLKKFYTTF